MSLILSFHSILEHLDELLKVPKARISGTLELGFQIEDLFDKINNILGCTILLEFAVAFVTMIFGAFFLTLVVSALGSGEYDEKTVNVCFYGTAQVFSTDIILFDIFSTRILGNSWGVWST